MSHRIGNTVFLEPTAPTKCDLCGKHEELRPYGPNGEDICFACAMKDKECTKRQMGRVLFDVEMH